jgi:hypothetical protein
VQSPSEVDLALRPKGRWWAQPLTLFGTPVWIHALTPATIIAFAIIPWVLLSFRQDVSTGPARVLSGLALAGAVLASGVVHDSLRALVVRKTGSGVVRFELFELISTATGDRTLRPEQDLVSGLVGLLSALVMFAAPAGWWFLTRENASADYQITQYSLAAGTAVVLGINALPTFDSDAARILTALLRLVGHQSYMAAWTTAHHLAVPASGLPLAVIGAVVFVEVGPVGLPWIAAGVWISVKARRAARSRPHHRLRGTPVSGYAVGVEEVSASETFRGRKSGPNPLGIAVCDEGGGLVGVLDVPAQVRLRRANGKLTAGGVMLIAAELPVAADTSDAAELWIAMADGHAPIALITREDLPSAVLSFWQLTRAAGTSSMPPSAVRPVRFLRRGRH